MKQKFAMLTLVAALVLPVVSHAEQTKMDPEATQQRLEEVHQHLMKMEATVEKMQSAKSEAERKQLMNEHSAMMDKGMTLMTEMHEMDQMQRRGCSFHPKQTPNMVCKQPQTPQGAELDLMQMMMRMMMQQRAYDASVSKGLEQ